MKRIDTQGIAYFDLLEGSTEWYWGMDYTSGDLYEAEELFRMGHRIRQNRLLFLHYPDGRLLQPFLAKEGQYLGRPIFADGRITLLLADFPAGLLSILAHDAASGQNETLATMPLAKIKDCYNLTLHGWPLMLARQGGDGLFQILWPQRQEFRIANTESFDFRDGERLYFSQWFEDPDYREELVLRRLDGEILERRPGTVKHMPNGEKWLLG